jgi:predicted dehydrogenase
MRAPIRWGIVGCGDVTERKSGPALRSLPDSRLVAVMRRDLARAEDYARRHGVPRFYGTVDALLDDPEVDAVYVATPPSSHAEIAIACAARGKPAYVEKPMATSARECERMIAAFEAAGVPLFVAYYRRALPRFRRVKAWLDEGAIGRPLVAQTTLCRPPTDAEKRGELPWRVRPEIAGGGHFVDLACHTLDLLDWLLGPIVEARGHSSRVVARYPAEDTAAASWRHDGGVLGSGSWTFEASARADATILVGTEGELRFSTFGDAPIALTTRNGTEEHAIANPDPIQEPMIASIVAALLGRGTCESTGASAARTSRAIDAILADARGR